MDSSQPLVSVIIPTYKRPDTLTRAINSVLAQTYINVEVIVVDDNNPDSEGRQLTEDVMEAYLNIQRVKYIKHEHNKNGSAARNTGVRNTNAKYVAFLDDDDEFLQEKIAMQVEKMESLSEEWAACYTSTYIEFNGVRKLNNSETREGNLLKEALKRNFKSGAGSNLLIRKRAFDDIGGFDESFVRNQDYEIIVKLFTRYKIAYVNKPGVVIYAHVSSKSINYDEVTSLFIRSFKKYIDLLSKKDQKDIYSTLNKQRFSFKLRLHHDIKGCVKMLLSEEITLKDAFYTTLSGFVHYVKNGITNMHHRH